MAYETIRFTIADPLLSTLKGIAGDESIHLKAKRFLSEILEGKEPTIEPTALAEIQSRLEKLETQEVNPVAPDALEEIRDRLNIIEKNSYVTKTDLAPYWIALGKIGDRLNTLEEGIGLGADDLDRLVQILKERIFDESLKQLGDRLNTLENERPQQTQEFLQKLMTENKFDLLEQYGDRLTELEESIGMSADDLDKLTEEIKGRILDESLKPFSDRLDALEKGKVETAPREIPKGLNHKQMAEICEVTVYAVTKMAHDRSKWPEGYMWSDESKKWFPMEV